MQSKGFTPSLSHLINASRLLNKYQSLDRRGLFIAYKMALVCVCADDLPEALQSDYRAFMAFIDDRLPKYPDNVVMIDGGDRSLHRAIVEMTKDEYQLCVDWVHRLGRY